MPFISVIIPTYNRGRYVTEAIGSVLNQSFKDYEIIVVDDGSSDNTYKMLQFYSDWIKYIYQENEGVSSARNTGVRAATGKWIAFLDSDDVWFHNYLAFQFSKILKYQDVEIHMTNATHIQNDGKGVSNFPEEMLNEVFRNSCYEIIPRPFGLILKYHLCFLQSAVIRKDAILKAGLFNEKLTIAEDLDLITRIALHGSMGIYKEPLVRIYRRDESIDPLSKQRITRGFYTLKSFEFVYESLSINNNLTLYEKKILNQISSFNKKAIGNFMLQKKNRKEAIKYYKKALLVYPSISSFVKYFAICISVRFALFFVFEENILINNLIPMRVRKIFKRL